MNYHKDDVTKYLIVTGEIHKNLKYYILIMGEMQFNYSITATNPTINTMLKYCILSYIDIVSTTYY